MAVTGTHLTHGAYKQKCLLGRFLLVVASLSLLLLRQSLRISLLGLDLLLSACHV